MTEQTNPVIKRELPVTLEADEYQARAVELANTVREIEELEQKKKRLNEAIKNEIGGAITRQEELLDIVSTGKESQPVDVEVVRDYRAKEVRYIRLDLGEVIEERAMTQDELQTGFDTEGSA